MGMAQSEARGRRGSTGRRAVMAQTGDFLGAPGGRTGAGQARRERAAKREPPQPDRLGGWGKTRMAGRLPALAGGLVQGRRASGMTGARPGEGEALA
jgi:hypothetical protein